MAKARKKNWLIPVILFFIIYVFVAARPVPGETVLLPRWLTSLDSGFTINIADNSGDAVTHAGTVIPFRLGNRYGYIDDSGRFLINRIQRESNLSLSSYGWSEYGATPSTLDIFDQAEQPVMTIKNPGGYPFFLDNRVFIIGNEQNSIKCLDSRGEEQWAYDFPAPLTCVDAASGYVLAGMLDGAIEVLNSSGRQIYSFEPGGSRLAVILGCAISADGAKLAIVSGIDNQRFLVLEQSGDTYRVVYHEFISDGFRRAVHVNFIDNDKKIAYEREGGIGIYDFTSRTGLFMPMEGEIMAMDPADNKYLFLVTSGNGRKRLIGILIPDSRMPPEIVIDAPFRSANAFLGRQNSRLFVGGDQGIISFDLGKK